MFDCTVAKKKKKDVKEKRDDAALRKACIKASAVQDEKG